MNTVCKCHSFFIKTVFFKRSLINVSCLALLFFFVIFFNQATFAQGLAERTQNTASALENIQKLPSLSALKVTTGSDGSQEYSVSIQILAIMTALSFIPAILLMTTSFTRIIIVFAILLGSEYCNVEDADNLFRISLHTLGVPLPLLSWTTLNHFDSLSLCRLLSSKLSSFSRCTLH